MRFERMVRLAALASAALIVPGMLGAAAPVAAAQSAPVRSDDYRWIDQADALWDAIGDAPPDLAFAFEGQEPWAWQTADGYTIIVEDAGEGGIRSYYFAPGARGPFLAVEPGMSFAFEGGRLAMVYDADGEAAPRAEHRDYAEPAMDLYARGEALRAAMEPRAYRPVDTEAWIDASPYLFGFIQLWDEGRSRYPGWRDYHRRSDAEAWRRRFEAEQARRRAIAERFRDWRAGGFQGPPPGRWHAPGHQPGRPDGAHPRQPGWGWSHGGWSHGAPGGTARPPRPGGDGRPPHQGRPGRPGGSGATPPAPGTAAPPYTRATPDRPDAMPGWRRGRPNSGMPAPVTVPDADAPVPTPPVARPPREGGGWQRPGAGAPASPPVSGPVSGGAPTPPVARPPRDGSWQRPAPAPTPPAPGVTPTPPAGAVSPPPRPREWGWRRPVATPGGAPTPPDTGAAPQRPQWTRPAPQPGAAPTPPPASEAPRARPEWGWRRPSAAPAPESAPAPRPQFVPRPSYTPSAPRGSAPPPVSRPAPPPVFHPAPPPPPPPPQARTNDAPQN